MKLKIMTSEAIAYVKENINSLTEYYKTDNNPEIWLKEKIGRSAFVEINELQFDDFELLTDSESPSSTDVPNSKMLYSKLITLNDSFATDERLWAGLSHTIFYKYMLKRWNYNNDANSILNHFFFNAGKPRCYMVNTIARLWWLSKKTYISNDENHFQILDYISHDINGYSFTLFGSNWSNSERSLKLFFKAIFKFEEDKVVNVGRGLFNDAMKYMNCLCGLFIIDACDDSFIVDKIYNYLEKRNEQLIRNAELNKLNNVKTTGIERLDNIIKALNYIGGRGNINSINKAYEHITNQNLSDASKKYIQENLEKNSPDSPSYNGKPIFYKIYVDNSQMWKISNEYLTRSNYLSFNSFISKQRESLKDFDKIVFNVISAIKGDKISVSSITPYRQQILQIYPEIKNFDYELKNALKNIRSEGLIEYIGDNTYKKSYKSFVIE